MTYGIKFEKIAELKEELKGLEVEVEDAPYDTFKPYYYKILEIAMKAGDLADGTYDLMLGRIERGYKMLSIKVLKGCVEYAWWMLRATDNYLCVKMANEYLCLNEKGQAIVKRMEE